VLAVLCLLLSGLASALVGTAPSAVAKGTFQERWCGPGVPAPCLLSLTRNGVAVTADDPHYEVVMYDFGEDENGSEVDLILHTFGSPGDLDSNDTWSMLVDMGTRHPDETEGYAAVPVVQRIGSGSSHQLRYTGKPVLVTSGCNDSFPSNCPQVAQGQSIDFEVAIRTLKVNKEFIGFDRSQNVDTINGIFLEHTRDGEPYLESEWDNSHFLTDGTTLAVGQARFRIPWPMLHDEFDVPDPKTMVAQSFVGSINGKKASFDVSQDPQGGGVYVDISGVTFSKKDIRIEMGRLTPTRPTGVTADRTGTKVKLAFDRAGARGAKVTRYQATCTAKGSVRTAYGKKHVTLTGLLAGKKYACRVRAASKAGYGAWSKAVRV
jgi:hypothetical protein